MDEDLKRASAGNVLARLERYKREASDAIGVAVICGCDCGCGFELRRPLEIQLRRCSECIAGRHEGGES